MHVRLSTNELLDVLIGWHGAAPQTRARLLEAFCSGIHGRSLITNAVTALIATGLIIVETRALEHMVWLLAAIGGGAAPRAYAARLRRGARFDERPERKALMFIAISAAYGLVWGLGPFLLLPQLSGEGVGIVLMILVFATVMGPYAAMPGILYARLASTGIPSLVAVALYTSPRVTVLAVVIGIWLVLRTDIWRGYHQVLRRQIELRETLERRKEELQRANHAEQQANARLKILADTDPLTGAANRRQFMARLAETTGPAALVLLDIDHFKSINDTFGHQTGDAVLLDITTLVQAVLRKDDLLARLGGDEFAILLPSTGLDEAWGIAERVRQSIGARVMGHAGEAIGTTVSIGIAATDGEHGGAELLQAADAALYAAKRGGRNRIHADAPCHRVIEA